MRDTLLDSILEFYPLQFPNSQTGNHTQEISIEFILVRLKMEMKTYVPHTTETKDTRL